MREVEPHEMSRGLGGIAHEMMVIGPNEGNKQIAHRITEPCRPERQQRFEGRKLRGTQIQNEHSYENGEDPVGERAQPLRRPSRVWHGCRPLLHDASLSCRASVYRDLQLRKSRMLSAISRACIAAKADSSCPLRVISVRRHRCRTTEYVRFAQVADK